MTETMIIRALADRIIDLKESNDTTENDFLFSIDTINDIERVVADSSIKKSDMIEQISDIIEDWRMGL